MCSSTACVYRKALSGLLIRELPLEMAGTGVVMQCRPHYYYCSDDSSLKTHYSEGHVDW